MKSASERMEPEDTRSAGTVALPAGASGRRTWIAPILLLAAALVLVLANLGNHYLWQDEAQTALIGKTILSHGTPRGTDGKNFFSQERGSEYGKNYIWRWHAWLQFYLVAPSLALLGSTTIAARLPFALLGVATVLLTYFLAKRLYGSTKAGVLAALLLVTSVPFLLLVRQCRYYSAAAFFSLLGLHAYLSLLQRKRGSAILFVVATTLVVHSHHIYIAPLLATTFLHAAFFHRERLRLVFLTSAVAVLINLPALLWFLGAPYEERYVMTAVAVRVSLAYYAEQMARHLFHPALLLLAALNGAFAWWRRGHPPRPGPRTVQALSLLALFVLTTFVVLCVSNPQQHFRYLAPMIPAVCLVIALILERTHTVVAGAVLVALALHGSMLDYVYEITHDYRGPVKGIVSYLREHSDPDDTVAISYDDLPVKFYTPLRVIGGLTGEDLSDAKRADFVIVRYHFSCGKDQYVRSFLIKNVDFINYRRVTIDYPDLPTENREDPFYHAFRTVEDAARVVIFVRDEELGAERAKRKQR
ncbi:MAG: glycosyltransferase family 39 protein [Planctomycetota bacterium]